MASRRFTVDPAKKKKFLNFILQMPKLRVPDAMKLAMFSDKDTTTSAQIRTLELIMRHCVVPPAAVDRAKSSWGGRGSSLALT